MAEALGVVGSIIAIVQISKTVIAACQFYIDAADGASSDLRVVLIEVSTLKGIAKSLRYLSQPGVATSALLEQLAEVTGPIEGCKKALEELEALFPATASLTSGKSSARRKLNAAVATLGWPMKAGKAKKLLQEIVQYKTTINLALTAEFVTDLKDVKQKMGRIVDTLNDSERMKICRFVETTDPCAIHYRSQRLFEPGTASWILRTPEWALWIEGTHRCLWINGIPGAGKSILASFIAEEVDRYCKAESKEARTLGHAYYYCYFGHHQDEASHFLGWTIGQLCRQSKRIPEELQNIYQSGKSPSLPSLLDILHDAMEAFDRVYVVLDAVDESMPRSDLLRVIRDISTDARFQNLGLIVTSRLYIDIEQVVETCAVSISMSNPFVEEDIRTLVQSTVRSDVRYKRWPEDLKCELHEVIPRKAKGMFRWAVCQLETLKRLRPEPSIIRDALSNLPRNLDETYERIFLAIPQEYWVSVQHVFYWLVYHNELYGGNIPLKVLLQAVQHSKMDFDKYDTIDIHDTETLRDCCGCLILIEEEKPTNRYTSEFHLQRSTVTFAHYTVKEYMQSARIIQGPAGSFALYWERRQHQLAEIILRQSLDIAPDKVARCSSQGSEHIRMLIEQDFQSYGVVSAALQLYTWPEAVSADSTLMELNEVFVNPQASAYPTIAALLDMISLESDVFTRSDLHRQYRFWSIEWRTQSKASTAIFLNFLVTAGLLHAPHLAVSYAETHSMLPLLTETVRIRKPMWAIFENEDQEYYEFDGTLPELCAQWVSRQIVGFNFILDLITGYGTSHFDLSAILLSYIAGFEPLDCEHRERACTLERLLRLGAGADGPKEAFVSALQIATASWDLHSVQLLVRAGADLNRIGGSDPQWPRNSLLARYNHLHGLNPLHIIRHTDCIYESDFRGAIRLDESERQKIETLLLETGAEEIVPVRIESTSGDRSTQVNESKTQESGDGGFDTRIEAQALHEHALVSDE